MLYPFARGDGDYAVRDTIFFRFGDLASIVEVIVLKRHILDFDSKIFPEPLAEFQHFIGLRRVDVDLYNAARLKADYRISHGTQKVFYHVCVKVFRVGFCALKP